MHPAITSRIKIMSNLDISERRLPQDGDIHAMMEGRPIDLRVSTIPGKFGEKFSWWEYPPEQIQFLYRSVWEFEVPYTPVVAEAVRLYSPPPSQRVSCRESPVWLSARVQFSSVRPAL